MKWEYLQNLQEGESYKRWSGLAVFSLIAYQWALTLVRMYSKNPNTANTFYKIHTWLGAFAPLIFYIHSTEFGYAYMFALSLSFYANYILGMFNLDVIKTKSMVFFQGWMIVHVSLSLIITTLSIYHIWIVFYYN